MAKNKKVGRFSGLIDQMNKDRHHLVLVNLKNANAFVNECIRRGHTDVQIGDTYKEKVVIYR